MLDKSAKSADGRLEFTFTASLNDRLSLTPQSETDFFKPIQVTHMVKAECSANVVEFTSKAGIFIEGFVRQILHIFLGTGHDFSYYIN